MSNEFNNEENQLANFEDLALDLAESNENADEVTTGEPIKEQENLVDVDNEEPEAKIEELPVIPANVVEEQKATDSDKVAVHSTRNVTWNGVGKVYTGYNIVTQEQADKWLTRDHIRLATPQEVAKEFGL